RNQPRYNGADIEAVGYDDHHQDAPATRCVLANERNGIRHDAAQSHTRDEPGQAQFGYRSGQSRPQRDQREEQRSDNQHRPPPEPVGQHAEKQRSHQNADERSAEYRAHLGGRKTPILNNRGSKIAESLNIESVHDQAKGTQNKDAGLKCSDLALVDGFGDVDRALHYGWREYITSPRFSFWLSTKT